MFKVGDWVRIGDTIQQIVEINPDNDYNITSDMIETNDDYVSIESVELWQPIESELACWYNYFRKDNTKYTVGYYTEEIGKQFDNVVPIEFIQTLKYSQ